MIRQFVDLMITIVVLYSTLNAYKASKTDRKLYRRYTKYFTVMTLFLLLDNLLYFVLKYIPFYNVIRLLISLWLAFPLCTGALFAYKFYVTGFMVRYEADCDKLVESVAGKIYKFLNEYYIKAQTKYREHREKRVVVPEEKQMGIRDEEANKIPISVDDTSESTFDGVSETSNVESIAEST